MGRLTLAPAVDLGVFYEADAARYQVADPSMLEVVTRDAFIRYYEACPSIGFDCDGQPIGGIIFDGREAHIAVLSAFRGRWAWLLKSALDWLFAQKPEILVEIEADNLACIAFMDHNRWRRVHTTAEAITYLMVNHRGTRKTAHPFSRSSR